MPAFRTAAALVLVLPLVPVFASPAVAAATCDGKPATISGTRGPDLLFGTPGDDVIAGRGGDDIIYGRGGDDLICGNGGADVIGGDGGSDEIIGGTGRDILRGDAGRDVLRGEEGADALFGGRHDDTLIGGADSDTLIGGPGVDVGRGGGSNDWCRTTESPTSCSTSDPRSSRAIDAGKHRTAATFEHLGFLWEVDDDTDLDSRMVLEFRNLDTSRWKPGAPAVRAYPSIYVQDGPLGLDSWGASAMFLDSGVEYELRATIHDPDGGSRQRTASKRTRVVPFERAGARQRWVEPGSGGGTGSQQNPFRGLQTAADAAQPGDVFNVAPGTYSPFQMLISGTRRAPIVFRGPGDGSALVDGGGTDRGIVTLGEYNQTLGWVIVEGLTLENGHWGVDAQHTHDIVLRHLEILDVDDGVTNRRGDALESNQTVCDNVIHGRTPWPGLGIPGERGIDLRGDGNVVCHNEVRNFGDCVSIQPATGPSYGNDVYGNDAAFCVDDGIEVDYNQANVRVWRNRVTNARMGVSVQPIRGGPAYILRNEFFNLESVPVKMHNSTTGFVVAHNTGVKHGDGHGDNGAMWRNASFRNNLFLGTRYAFEFTTVPDEGFRDFDFNGWGTSRQIGSPSDPWFKWDNVRYDRIGDLPAGVEDNGVEVGFADLRNPGLPSDWDVAAVPGDADLRLRRQTPGVNAGTVLWNLNDGFSVKGRPDLGAHERRAPLPHYGPRAN